MRIINPDSLPKTRAELKALGVDPAGINIMAPKMVFRVIKLNLVRSVAANILKQEMLALGGEAAVSYGAVNLSRKTTDVLIGGTLKQFSALIKKLRRHCFGLPRIANDMERALSNYNHSQVKRTRIMGILNITPDSFSDGGEFITLEKAYQRAIEMKKAGADILDVGGESTRPGARPVSKAEEIKRVVPVIKKIKKLKVTISIDTRRAAVAEAALKAGARMINDVSALRHDKKMAGIAAKYKVPVVLMHMQGTPQNMQKAPKYDDLLREIIEYLKGSISIARAAGIKEERIILDPGFGFGKTVEHNLQLLDRLRELKILGHPLLIGTSRKSTLGHILGSPPGQRLMGSAATNAIAILNGADIIRVHDVAEMRQVAKMTDAIVGRHK